MTGELSLCFKRYFLFQCGDRGERARRGRVHRAERLRRDQRQPDGAADHDQRLQDRLGLPRHRRHPLLPVRPAGQERQGEPRWVSGQHCCLTATRSRVQSLVLDLGSLMRTTWPKAVSVCLKTHVDETIVQHKYFHFNHRRHTKCQKLHLLFYTLMFLLNNLKTMKLNIITRYFELHLMVTIAAVNRVM